MLPIEASSPESLARLVKAQDPNCVPWDALLCVKRLWWSG